MIIIAESPGTTLHLLKVTSQKARAGFKRKKLDVLGSFKEVKDGTKKLTFTATQFAQPQVAKK